DFLRRYHDAEIDDFVIVALKHDADDVLADIVDVAFNGGHHDLAVGGDMRPAVLLLLHIRQQISHRLLHDASRFDNLRQEHPPRAEQVADDVHAVHQLTFDD